MRRTSEISAIEARARDCAIRAAIGRALAAQYNLAEPLSERLDNLVKRFEGIDENSARPRGFLS